jgi:hypothetical protein
LLFLLPHRQFFRNWVSGLSRAAGSWQANELKSHSHSVNAGTNTSNSLNNGGTVNLAPSTSGATGGSETRPDNISQPVIIYLGLAA